MAHLRTSLIVFAPWFGGCFYDVPPLAADGGADAIADVSSDRGPQTCSAASGPCVAAVAAGWTPLAFAPSRANGCPSNFLASDLVSDPVAPANTCVCTCNIATQPSCSIGVATLNFGSTSQCTGAPSNYNITANGQCVDFGFGNFTENAFQKWTKLGLTAGTCNGSATADASKLTATPVRACAPSPACNEDVCNGTVPAGFKSCITHDNDLTCPAGPFTQKFLAGTSTSAQCSTCSACTISAQCGAATVRSYGDAACTILKDSITADGTCNTTAGATLVNHFRYDAPVQNVTCTPGASLPTVDLALKRTICCR